MRLRRFYLTVQCEQIDLTSAVWFTEAWKSLQQKLCVNQYYRWAGTKFARAGFYQLNTKWNVSLGFSCEKVHQNYALVIYAEYFSKWRFVFMAVNSSMFTSKYTHILFRTVFHHLSAFIHSYLCDLFSDLLFQESVYYPNWAHHLPHTKTLYCIFFLLWLFTKIFLDRSRQTHYSHMQISIVGFGA